MAATTKRIKAAATQFPILNVAAVIISQFIFSYLVMGPEPYGTLACYVSKYWDRLRRASSGSLVLTSEMTEGPSTGGDRIKNYLRKFPNITGLVLTTRRNLHFIYPTLSEMAQALVTDPVFPLPFLETVTTVEGVLNVSDVVVLQRVALKLQRVRVIVTHTEKPHVPSHIVMAGYRNAFTGYQDIPTSIHSVTLILDKSQDNKTNEIIQVKACSKCTTEVALVIATCAAGSKCKFKDIPICYKCHWDEFNVHGVTCKCKYDSLHNICTAFKTDTPLGHYKLQCRLCNDGPLPINET